MTQTLNLRDVVVRAGFRKRRKLREHGLMSRGGETGDGDAAARRRDVPTRRQLRKRRRKRNFRIVQLIRRKGTIGVIFKRNQPARSRTITNVNRITRAIERRVHGIRRGGLRARVRRSRLGEIGVRNRAHHDGLRNVPIVGCKREGRRSQNEMFGRAERRHHGRVVRHLAERHDDVRRRRARQRKSQRRHLRLHRRRARFVDHHRVLRAVPE